MGPLVEPQVLPEVASAALKWIAVGYAMASFISVNNGTAPRGPSTRSFTLLDVAYGICNLGTSSLLAWQGCVLAKRIYMDSSELLLSLLNFSQLTALSLVLIAVVNTSIYTRWRQLGAPFLLCGSHFFHLVGVTTDLLLVTGQTDDVDLIQSKRSLTTWNALLVIMVTGSFLYSGLQATPVIERHGKRVAGSRNEDTHSVFRRLVCTAVLRHIWNAAFRAKVIRDEMPVLCKAMLARTQMNALDKLQRKYSGYVRPTTVLFWILRVVWREILWTTMANQVYYASLLVRIPILQQLLNSETSSELLPLTALFVASCAAEFLLGCIEAERSHLLAVRTKSLCQGAIFTKVTRMSPCVVSRYPASHVASLLAVECSRLSIAVAGVPKVAVGLLCTLMVLYALWRRVGTLPVLCCVCWQLFTFLLLIPSVNVQRTFWMRMLKWHDARLKKIADVLSSVRLVKFYAWEEAFVDSVTELRRREVNEQFACNIVDGFLDCLFVSSSSVMSTVLFTTLAYFYPDQRLTAGLSFSCVYALSLLDPINSNIVASLRMVLMASLGLRRISAACAEEERDAPIGPPMDKVQPNDELICLEKCTFAWTSRKPSGEEISEVVLRDVDLTVKRGSLLGVVGAVGSGKSALLAALQGELHRISGHCRIVGPMAYVPQSACIYNMSVRDNIIFGQPFDIGRYSRVLDACDLLQDLASFPARDHTEIGDNPPQHSVSKYAPRQKYTDQEVCLWGPQHASLCILSDRNLSKKEWLSVLNAAKGATLSGGQKQRIALARAAYCESSVYLLDDTLSALDVHVASRVFERVIGKKGILRKKTRIVVCNQNRYLEQMDNVLLVAKKRVLSFASFAEMVKDSMGSMAIQLYGKEDREMEQPSMRNTTQEDENATAGRVTQDEVEVSKMGSMDLFFSLARICGPSAAFSALCFAGRAAVVGTYIVWIKYWTDANARQDFRPMWVIGLGALCLSDVFLGWLGALSLAVGLRNLSTRMHEAMIRRVLGSPVGFFDATPRGRVLNRFSADIDNIENRFFLAAKQVIETLMIGAARIAVTGLLSPAAGFVAASTTAIFLFLVAMVAKASNAARRLESVERSHLLQKAAETRDSLSVVRSFRVEKLFCQQFYRLADVEMRALLALFDCLRHVRFLGGLCGFLVILSAVVFALLASGHGGDLHADGSAVGLALNSSMGISLLIIGSTISVFVFTLTFVSFERCLEYTRLPAEADEPEGFCKGLKKATSQSCDLLSSCKPVSTHAPWPSGGTLEFDHYTASYRPGKLPDALANVCFVVNTREKVGIVGRTGAGKSSLFMALLRVLKPTHGSIRIDGVDIASVPLRMLRSVVTIIPQDPSLMRGTLRGALDPTRSHSYQEVWNTLQQVHLADFVSRHPDNILLEVGDAGRNLSAGQRQLVCLGRALLRRPRVLLLDEATSHMDGDTARLVQRTLQDSFAHCTVLAIAHSLETVLDYDKILVMDGGKVIEFGDSKSLAANPNSKYHGLLRLAGMA